MKKVLHRWLPVLVWAALIYSLSDIPSLASPFATAWDYVLRKIAHATEFGILTVLLLRALGRSETKTVTIAVVLAVVYAVADEYHQTFVAGRSGAFPDVLIDTIGISLGAWFFYRRKRAFRKT